MNNAGEESRQASPCNLHPARRCAVRFAVKSRPGRSTPGYHTPRILLPLSGIEQW